jgi:hypothetical protein
MANIAGYIWTGSFDMSISIWDAQVSFLIFCNFFAVVAHGLIEFFYFFAELQINSRIERPS